MQTTYFGTGPGGKRCFFFFSVILQLWPADDFGEFFLGEMVQTTDFWRMQTTHDNTMAQHTVQRDASFRSSFRTMKLKTPNGTRDRSLLDAAKPRKPLGNFRGETLANSNGFNFRASNLMTSGEVGFRNPRLTER